MAETAEARDWLGGEVGEPPKGLTDKLRKILLRGFQEGKWTLDEVPGEDEVDTKDLEELWKAILVDSAALDGSVKLGAADEVRFRQWLRGHLDLKDGSEDGGASNVAVSEKERQDLDAQGMSDPRIMRHVDLGMLLGRVGSKEGIRNGRYRGIPNQMDDAKLAFKQRHSTIRDVLAECKRTKSTARMERFITTLAADMVESGDPEIEKQAARVLQWWQAICRNLMGRWQAILAYIEEYLDFYRGRGLPVIYDAVIGQRAMFSEELEPQALSTLGMKTGGSSTASGSSSGQSSIAPSDSVSQLGGSRPNREVLDVVEAQALQMKELMDSLRGVRDTVGDLSRRMSSIQGDDSQMKCLKCGEKGHRAANCPTKRKNQEKTEE
jgi:hypothetical protein